ncbi:hypothetical protein [Kitasatospora sp. NPDC059571]
MALAASMDRHSRAPRQPYWAGVENRYKTTMKHKQAGRDTAEAPAG